MQVTLTIAIPTFNGSKTIRDALNSVLAQYDPRLDILIVNNCSTDETDTVVREYQQKYTYIRSIRNETNIGPDGNFLKSMQNSKGRFVWLLSDDDVLIENALKNILDFLDENQEIALAYLHTIGFHGKYKGREYCIHPSKEVNRNICTSDKIQFMEYAMHYWGFMSSFLCASERVMEIENAEKYYGTYWLQSYIHILCAKGKQTKLGIIKGPCVGAGTYVNIANLDTSQVDGIFYKKMLDFAVEEGGFDRAQLDDLYKKRICSLGKRAIIKERASRIHKTNVWQLIKCTYRFSYAWLNLYPFLLIPSPLCSLIMKKYRNYRGLNGNIHINREE